MNFHLTKIKLRQCNFQQRWLLTSMVIAAVLFQFFLADRFTSAKGITNGLHKSFKKVKKVLDMPKAQKLQLKLNKCGLTCSSMAKRAKF